MKNITYYKVEFILESSLSIGSGIGEYTDKDIAADRYGKPYIPASSIAGVMRSSLNDDMKKKLFGSIDKGADEGCVRFYDAELCSGDIYIATRDCVALAEKVAVEGAKFDFQAVEPGVSFVGYIEVHDFDKTVDVAAEIENILKKFNSGELRLGSKTTRGYGRVSVKAGKRVFQLPDDLSKWLEFDQYTSEGWEEVSLSGDAVQYISLNLINTAGVTVREYTTDCKENVTLPDYRQISLHDNSGDGVIPGTSWAGAFRQRFSEFAESGVAEELFGYVNDRANTVKKSEIVFSESLLKDGKRKQLTRNSIDRFSAATKNGALYTEETYYGGTTVLTISFPKGISEKNLKILAHVILDLHYGYLAIGGLVSVGRGIFRIESFKTNVEGFAGILNEHGITREVQ